MVTQGFAQRSAPLPGPEQSAAVRWAASKLTGATRRAFEAEMTMKDCGGNARQAAGVFGWGRHPVALGRAERRTGSMGLGAPSPGRGRPRWADTQTPVAEALRQPAEPQAPHAPTFRPSLASTRLTAKGALAGRRAQGSRDDQRPAPATRAAGRHRRDFRLRQVVKAKAQKKRKEPDAIFANIKKRLPRLRQREGAHAGASLGKRRCPWGSWRGAVCRGAITKLASTTAVAGKSLSRVAASMPTAGSGR